MDNELEEKIYYPDAIYIDGGLKAFNVIFDIIFFALFSISYLFIPYSITSFIEETGILRYLYVVCMLPFYVIPLICLYSIYKMYQIDKAIRQNGRTVKGVLYDYEIDYSTHVFGKYGYTALIKIPTEEGDRTIRHMLRTLHKPYEINTEFEILLYDKYYLIKKK